MPFRAPLRARVSRTVKPNLGLLRASYVGHGQQMRWLLHKCAMGLLRGRQGPRLRSAAANSRRREPALPCPLTVPRPWLHTRRKRLSKPNLAERARSPCPSVPLRAHVFRITKPNLGHSRAVYVGHGRQGAPAMDHSGSELDHVPLGAPQTAHHWLHRGAPGSHVLSSVRLGRCD